MRCIEGEIFDVAVDIRRGSPTFGKWDAATISAENFHQIYVPPGYAHGFCVMSDRAQVEYKTTDIYDPGAEITVLWNDPDVAIEWPVEVPILSAKDGDAKTLKGLADALPSYKAGS